MAVLADPWSGLAAFRGQVIDRAHPEYELARGIFNGVIDRRPGVIVRPLDAGDVQLAIELARAEGLPLSIRGGGHNIAGHALCDDGIMIDLGLMRDVRVEPETLTASAGGGATWKDFDPACQRHGLATPGGTFGTTGVGGLTLGGGLGHLMGVHGLTLDNLVGAEVVTAAGDVLLTGEHEHGDLFWALRGGGGNFGVVTQFVFRVHRLPPLEGGVLVYAFPRAREVLRGFRDVAERMPDELYSVSLLTHDRTSGEPAVVVSVCMPASSDDARSAVHDLRGLPGLVVDAVRPMSYLQVQGMFGEVPFGLRHYWKGHFVRGLPDQLIDFLVEQFAGRASPLGGVLIEPLHGLVTRVPEDATAFANRGAAYNVSALSIWESPAADADEIAWARTLADGVAPHSHRGGGYVNYMSGDEPLERVEAAFGAEKFARLREVKRRYDPDNLFRHNQNIPPAAG